MLYGFGVLPTFRFLTCYSMPLQFVDSTRGLNHHMKMDSSLQWGIQSIQASLDKDTTWHKIESINK